MLHALGSPRRAAGSAAARVQRRRDGLQASNQIRTRIRGCAVSQPLLCCAAGALLAVIWTWLDDTCTNKGIKIDIIIVIHKLMRFKIRNFAAFLFISEIRSNIRNRNLDKKQRKRQFLNATSHWDKTLFKMAKFQHKSIEIWKIYKSRDAGDKGPAVDSLAALIDCNRNIFFPERFSLFPDKTYIFSRPLSFSPHGISKFRVRHETRRCITLVCNTVLYNTSL